MKYDDKEFIMNTVMLEVSENQEIDLSDLRIVYPKKPKGAWYIKRMSSGRGVARVLDNQF
jgi:hypothetical protein